MAHSVKVVKATRERQTYGIIFGERRSTIQDRGWRVRVQLTSHPSSAFESVTFYETLRGAENAARRIADLGEVA